MPSPTYSRHSLSISITLFLGLSGLAFMYVAALALRSPPPSWSALHGRSLPALQTSHLLKAEESRTPCVPPDWPADVVPPHIFMVGHSKTGSTYIHALLTQHPHIVEATEKEINFFPAVDIANPMAVYATFFPNRTTNNPKAISIDASISYVASPHVRDMLRNTFPCAKIVFLMRDPAVRWWSSYNHVQRRRQEALKRGEKRTLFSVEEHFTREMNKTRHDFQQVEFTKEAQKAGVSYFSLQRKKLPMESISSHTLVLGMYYSRIMEWLEVWPRSQVLLVNTEEFFDPATLNNRMRVLTDFAGLEPHKFKAMPPKLPAYNKNHKKPGDYGLLPEPYYSQIRAFYEPDLKLLKEHFGISFNASAGGDIS
jgi:hypothetical protein